MNVTGHRRDEGSGVVLVHSKPMEQQLCTGLNQVTRKGGRRDTKKTKGLVWTLELRN